MNDLAHLKQKAFKALIKKAKDELERLMAGLAEREREQAEFEVRKMLGDLDEDEIRFLDTYPDIIAGLQEEIGLASKRLADLQAARPTSH